MKRLYPALTSQSKALPGIQSLWDSGDEWMILGEEATLSCRTRHSTVTSYRFDSGGKQLEEAADGTVLFTVQAGEDWDDLAAHTVTAGLQGLNSLSGLPGCVGASIRQNIGAYDYELDHVLATVNLPGFSSVIDVLAVLFRLVVKMLPLTRAEVPDARFGDT